MFKEIGSNFFLDTETISSHSEATERVELNGKIRNEIYSSSGRGATSLVLDHIEPISKKALLPIYTCGSVIKPFLQKGYTVEFFDIEADLTISWSKLERSITYHNPGVVLLHSYFGFDSFSEIRQHIPVLREQGIVIIEDITHSLFSGFANLEADYFVASLRKWIAIPDGGIAFSAYSPLTPPTMSTQDKVVELNLQAFREKLNYTKSLDAESKEKYRNLFDCAELTLNEDIRFYQMSNTSKQIIQNTDFNLLKKARKENYQYLLNELKEIEFFKPVFSSLPQDVVPLFFPVFVEIDRTELRSYLSSKEIYMPIHWGIPKHFSGRLTENAELIYENILSIPIDQRYELKDMKRIIDLLKNYNSLSIHNLLRQ